MTDLNPQEREALRIALHAYRAECLAARVGGPRPGDFEAGYRAALAAREDTERPDVEKLKESVENGRLELNQHYFGGEDERVDHMGEWLDEHEALIDALRDTEQENER